MTWYPVLTIFFHTIHLPDHRDDTARYPTIQDILPNLDICIYQDEPIQPFVSITPISGRDQVIIIITHTYINEYLYR